MSWMVFYQYAAIAAIAVFLPGALFAKALRADTVMSIAFGPAITLFIMLVLGIAYPHLGIPANWFVILGVPTIVGVIACILSLAIARPLRKHRSGFASKQQADDREQPRSKPRQTDAKQLATLALYLVCGCIALHVVYLSGLDNPDCFLQKYDNIAHFNHIRAFLDNMDYSILHTATQADLATHDPEFSSSLSFFYPALPHVLAACYVSLLGVSLPVAENLVILVMCALVFPAGMYAMMRLLFPGRAVLQRIGAVTCMAFVGFPGNMLMWALFSNIAAFCLLPVILVSFMVLSWPHKEHLGFGRFVAALLFLATCITAAACQPNVIFSAAVFLACYALWDIAVLVNRKLPAFATALIAVACACAFAFVWYKAYRLPVMSDVVEFVWPAQYSLRDGALITLQLGFNPSYAVQPLLAVITYIGVVYAVVTRKYLWLAGPFLIALFMHFIGMSTDGALKQLLIGFWYTDITRIGGMAAIFGAPLAALGLYAVGQAVPRAASHFSKRVPSKLAYALATVGIVVFGLAVFWTPSITDDVDADLDLKTADRTYAFGYARNWLSTLTAQDDSAILSAEKIDFMNQVAETVPEGTLIINAPHDGSFWGYSLVELDTYFRYSTPFRGLTDDQHQIQWLMMWIDDHEELQQQLRDMDAHYVMLLDVGTWDDGHNHIPNYKHDNWAALEEVNDETAGFDVVLSEGHMRLYRISILDN